MWPLGCHKGNGSHHQPHPHHPCHAHAMYVVQEGKGERVKESGILVVR